MPSPEKDKHKEQPDDFFDFRYMYDLTKDLPASFKVTDEFLDYNEQYGLQLSKFVKDTPTSRKSGLCGKDIRTIRVLDICFMGIQNWYLRSISAGRWVGIEFTRSVRESIFTARLLKNLRQTGLESCDIDTVASAIAKRANKNFDTDEEKKVAYAEMADIVFKHIKGHIPNTDNTDMEIRLRALETENASLKQTMINGDGSAAKPTAKKKPKEIPTIFKKLGAKSSKAEVDAEDVEEDEEEEDTTLLLAQLARPKNARKILRKTSPKGTKMKDLDTWIKDREISGPDKTRIDLALDQIYKDFMSLPVAERTGLKELLTDWGAAVDFTSKLDHKYMIKLALVAAHLS
jgi:hypothetical protein